MELQDLHQVCTELGLCSNIELNDINEWTKIAGIQKQTVTTKQKCCPSPDDRFPVIEYRIDGISFPVIVCYIDHFTLDASSITPKIHFNYSSLMSYPFVSITEDWDGHKAIQMSATMDPDDPCVNINKEFINNWKTADEYSKTSKHQRHFINIEDIPQDKESLRKYLADVILNVAKAQRELDILKFRDAKDERK